MIGAADIERAERVLSVVYQADEIDRQLEMVNVDAGAFDNFIFAVKQPLKTRYGDAWAQMDPRLEPALNTILAHAFLTGVVAGRSAVQEVL